MSNLSESFTQSNTSDLLLLITQFVGNWKEFARCMNFLESQIRLIETHSKLQLSTEYASHFMKLFLDRKQDVTSWVFWCNLLNKFDDGKTCIEKIKSSELLVSSEDIFAEKHFELICNKIVDWRRFARYMKFNEEQIEEVRKDFKTIKGRNKFLMEQFLKTQNENSTWKFWKELLTKFDEGQICIKEIEEELQKFHIKNDDQSNGMIEEISNRISNWKEFARVMNFNKFEIVQVENGFKNIDKRCLYLMNTFVYREQDITSWMFWRNLLSKYEEGKLIIYEVEKLNNDLFCQGSQLTDHNVSYDKFKYMGHILEYSLNKRFNVDKNKATLAVQVGSSSFKFEDHQSFSEWVENQQRYMDTYNMFKDLKAVNFADLGNDFCPTLGAIKTHLEVTKDNGFVVKGYHYINHINKLKPGSFKEEINDNQYFCIFANDNIVLYVTKEDVPTEALYNATRNIQIANILHEDLQSKDIVQVNVILHNENKEFCKQCVDNDFYVDEEVFSDPQTFSLWYKNLVEEVKNNREREIDNVNEICTKIKKEMITYEALERSDLPSFSYCGDDQMEELKKIVLLTSMQLKVLKSKVKHIFLKGCYGSGKSLVLMKKFEQILNFVSSDEIIYFICNDQQSQFVHWLKVFLKTLQRKNIICCSSKDLLKQGTAPLLSAILKHVSFMWKDRNIHLFIDEFDGSYFDKKEIAKLKKVLKRKCFQNSFMIISLQSMEKYVVNFNIETSDNGSSDDSSYNDSSNYGYQFHLLPDFHCFELEYSLRCSYEISKFVKETSKVIESKLVEMKNMEHFSDHGVFVDSEYGIESNIRHTKNKPVNVRYNYNQSEIFGHSVSTGPVNIYHLDKDISDIPKNINHFYFPTLDFLLSDQWDASNNFVICTYRKSTYNYIYQFLEYSDYPWTNDIKEFIKNPSQYTVLLTDYGAIRGYEFPNFIFISPFGNKYLKYRLIECVTRATTELHILCDNIEVADDSIDNEIINKWKMLECVQFNVCVYNNANGQIKVLQGDEEIFLKTRASEIKFKEDEIYPWKLPFPEKLHGLPAFDEFNHDGDLLAGMKYIVECDDVDLMLDFVKNNDIKLDTFQCSKYTIPSTPTLTLSLDPPTEDKIIDPYNILDLAACRNSINIGKFLVNNSANFHDKQGNTALHFASMNGNTDFIDLLMDTNFTEIDTENDKGETALHLAAKYSHYASVKQLVNKQASLHKRTKEGSLPIHYAAAGNNPKIIELLISQQDEMNLQNYSYDIFINEINDSGLQKPLEKFNGCDVNEKDGIGQTPLFIAAAKGNKLSVEFFIKNNADVNLPRNDGQAALHIAARVGNINIVELLLISQADVHVKDKEGNEAIHVILKDEPKKTYYIDIVEILIKYGSSINECNLKGDTPLHLASQDGLIAIVEVLIDKGANIDARNLKGETPLHIAARVCNKKTVELLIAKNANVHLEDNDGNMPVDVVFIDDDEGDMDAVDIVKLLRRCCSNINKSNLKDTAI